MARNKGDENKLWTLHYSQIAAWVGLAVSTVRTYAQRKHFQRDSIESVLQWANGRRLAQGLPLIGIPAEISEDSEVDTLETESPKVVGNDVTPAQTTDYSHLASGYNPLKGGFE